MRNLQLTEIEINQLNYLTASVLNTNIAGQLNSFENYIIKNQQLTIVN